MSPGRLVGGSTTNRFRRFLAAAGVAAAAFTTVAVVDVATAPEASAATQQVCNRAQSGSVRVITNTGAKYNVGVGDCSGTNVVGWRPHYGNAAYAINRYGDNYRVNWRGDAVYSSTINGPISIGLIFRV